MKFPSWYSRINSLNLFFAATLLISRSSAWSSEPNASLKNIWGSSKPDILQFTKIILPWISNGTEIWPALCSKKTRIWRENQRFLKLIGWKTCRSHMEHWARIRYRMLLFSVQLSGGGREVCTFYFAILKLLKFCNITPVCFAQS